MRPRPPRLPNGGSASREKMKPRLQSGELEDREVEVTFPGRVDGTGLDFGSGQLRADGDGPAGMFEKIMPKQSQTRRLTVSQARPILLQQEIEGLIDPERSTRPP